MPIIDHAIADFKMQNTFRFEELCLYLLVACWGVPLSHWVFFVPNVVVYHGRDLYRARLPFRWGQGAIFCTQFWTVLEGQSHSHDHLHVHLRRPKAIFWTIYQMAMHTEWWGMGNGKTDGE